MLTFVDLFCGIGTIRMGFQQAGHKCVYSVEWDKHKRKIYSIIFGGEPEGADIRAANARDIPRADLWTFGAPCQDFSIAGKRAGMEGERSSLVREVFRLVRETPEEDRPKYLLYENVKGMLSSNGGRDFLGILSEMDEIGYDTEWDVLNTAEILPQNRERVFAIGHLRTKSTRKVFPIAKDGGMDTEARATKREKTEIIPCLEATMAKGVSSERFYSIAIPVLTPGRENKRQNGRRMKENGEPMLTLTAQDRHGIYDGHYLRYITEKEAWRLQGISDEITEKVQKAGISKSQMYRGAGDACTVNVIYEIAKKLT